MSGPDLTRALILRTGEEMRERLRTGIVLALAALSCLAPLKFTTPVVLSAAAYWPGTFIDWFFSFWPNIVFYGVLALVVLLALVLRPWKVNGKAMWVPIVFLLIQGVSTWASSDRALSGRVFELFASLVAGYFLGGSILQGSRDLKWVLLGWVAASVFVVISGIGQANGGLEETKRFLYQHPELASDPGIWKKIESPRIFATFIYPNALGGFVIGAIFMVAAWGIEMKTRARRLLIVLPALIPALIYCLWKSGSKGSYAALFGASILAVGLLVRGRRVLLMSFALVGFIFLLGFVGGYGSHAVEKGRQTWEARVGYWKAAWQIGVQNPVLGSGPGTFSRMYMRYKMPNDENTRLVHNNYLQMWSDSGFLGFVAFLLWLPGTLVVWIYRWRRLLPIRVSETLIWCGCFAFALHSLVDFDLYMISNSWPIFVLLGFLASSIPPKMGRSALEETEARPRENEVLAHFEFPPLAKGGSEV